MVSGLSRVTTSVVHWDALGLGCLEMQGRLLLASPLPPCTLHQLPLLMRGVSMCRYATLIGKLRAASNAVMAAAPTEVGTRDTATPA
jgi:hypothetical protein